MTKISNIVDFNNVTSKITSFSHAYLFDVNSLNDAINYIKEFAKRILCNGNYQLDCNKCNICYLIDNNSYDDLYIVNPSTIGINNEEIEKLMQYMQTKSLNDNGRRVYIVCGFERLSPELSNKILKFLEEPPENVYALLITENIKRILPTIISRCQVINLYLENKNHDDNRLKKSQDLLIDIINNGNHSITSYNYIVDDITKDRLLFYDCFDNIELIISNTINCIENVEFNETYVVDALKKYDIVPLCRILDITNSLKKLIKQNINLNLLMDRYIIEVTEVLLKCKK